MNFQLKSARSCVQDTSAWRHRSVSTWRACRWSLLSALVKLGLASTVLFVTASNPACAQMEAVPVTIDIAGTKIINGDKTALVGTSITASINNPTPGLTIVQDSIAWSVGGDTFKTYDPALLKDQLVRLTAADLTAQSLGFTDKTRETVTVNLNVDVKDQQGVITHESASTPVKFTTPKVHPWTLNNPELLAALGYTAGFVFDAKGKTMFSTVLWFPVTVLMPPSFSDGKCCLAQMVWPFTKITRNPTGGGAPSYSIKCPGPNNTWVSIIAGLDTSFPYPGTNSFINGEMVVGPDSTWAIANGTGTGMSSDQPRVPLEPNDVDTGGVDWTDAIADESFSTWLMFQPPNGCWVPLAKLNWSWVGIATKSGGVWTLVTGGNVPGIPSDTVEAPTWTAIFKGPDQSPGHKGMEHNMSSFWSLISAAVMMAVSNVSSFADGLLELTPAAIILMRAQEKADNGYRAMRIGRIQDAERLYREAYQMNPTCQAALFGMAETAERHHDIKAQLHFAEQALFNPGPPRVVRDNDASDLLRYAVAFDDVGRLADARMLFNKGFEGFNGEYYRRMYPVHIPQPGSGASEIPLTANNVRALSYLGVGMDAWEYSDRPKAIKCMLSALHYRKDLPEALFYLGIMTEDKAMLMQARLLDKTGAIKRYLDHVAAERPGPEKWPDPG